MESTTFYDRNMLASRVIFLMAELQQRKDPRYSEILEVLETARSSHPLFDPLQPTKHREPFEQGHRAIVNYVERNYHDLYGFLQRANPDS